MAITPMKLQKLAYFAHGWYLALRDDGPLIDDRPQAWDFGPVFPSLYHEFKDFGNRPIDRKAFTPVVNGTKLSFIQPTVDDEAKAMKCDSIIPKAVMDRVFKLYGNLSAIRLSEMTHVEGSPWFEIRKAAKTTFEGKIPKGLEIPDAMIREWFKSRMQKQTATA